MMRHALSRLLIGAALLAGCAALPLAPASAVAQQAKPEYPKFSIPNPSPNIPDQSGPTGAVAWNILQPYLPQIQAWYGLTAKQLSDGFNQPRDRSIDQGEWRLANDGRIVIKEKIVPYRFANTPSYHIGEDLDYNVFRKQSNPSAPIKIWLTYKSFDVPSSDPIPTDAFSVEEKSRLFFIWQRVAEDFAPFHVNVTTARPSLSELQRSSPSDAIYGVVVAIDRDSSSTAFAEGQVYLNSFDDLDDSRRKIKLKFPANAQDPASMAHMISHLLGHSLGLIDENAEAPSLSPFNGFETRIGSWAPIMGRPGNAAIRQFSQGEFRRLPDPSQIDSVARVSQVLPTLDDAGDTIQTAIPLNLVTYSSIGTQVRRTGVVERRGDKDFYVLNVGAGMMTAWVEPNLWSAQRVYPTITLFDQRGIEIKRGENVFNSGQVLVYDVLRAGTYYLQIGATGLGSPTAGGFTEYGSLGNYGMLVELKRYEGSPPEAILSATPKSGTAPLGVRLDASQSRDDGEVKFIYWDFGDGTKDETGALRRFTKTYAKPGTYQVSIRVVDDTGQSAITTETITVTQPVQNVVSANVDLRLINTSKTSSAAFGTLYVVDQTGKRMPNASVRYTWSGLQRGQRSVVSQAQGSPVMSLASSQKGCFVLTVTGITLAGYTYNANAPVTAQVCR